VVPLNKETVRCLNSIFPSKDRDAVCALLLDRCGDNLPNTNIDDHNFFERIRFAVLKLSHGDLEKMKTIVEAANYDWRDVLVAADFANDTKAHQKWFRTE
jgi:hypothetical protein